MEIDFEAQPVKVGRWTLVLLPKEASARLPSRGMAMMAGELNGLPFQVPLEPDGRRGHWFRLTDDLMEKAQLQEASTIRVSADPCEDWPNPSLPADLGGAIEADQGAREAWAEVTPKAQWDWLRWVRSTNNPATRNSRIEKAISMLNAGKRRPCCFDRNRCTEMEVSKNGVLATEV